MPTSSSEESFLHILDTPGLHHIVEEHILIHLDPSEWAKLESVCKSWRNLFISTQIWKKRLKELNNVNPHYNAFCALNEEDSDFDDFDLTQSHIRSKRLCLNILVKLPFSWTKDEMKVFYHPNHNLEDIRLSTHHALMVSHKIAWTVPTSSLLSFNECGIPLPLKPTASDINNNWLLMGTKSGIVTLINLETDQMLSSENASNSIESVALNIDRGFAFS